MMQENRSIAAGVGMAKARKRSKPVVPGRSDSRFAGPEKVKSRDFDTAAGGTFLFPQVLVLGTEKALDSSLKSELRYSGFGATYCNSTDDAFRKLRKQYYQVMIVDWDPDCRMTSGFFKRAEREAKNLPIIALMKSSDVSSFSRRYPGGAVDVLTKPFPGVALRVALSRLVPAGVFKVGGMGRRDGQEPRGPLGPELIGTSEALRRLREAVANAAASKANCLIHGPDGSGKSIVAQELCRIGNCYSGPWIKVNCGAQPAEQLEAELFGTDATTRGAARIAERGRLELAHEGVLVIEDIAELPLHLQRRLLEVIESRELIKKEGQGPIPLAARLVATVTERSYEKERMGAFLPELRGCLDEIDIHVPPLTLRREDIPLLVRHFAWKHHGQSGAGLKPAFSDEEMAGFLDYVWPGNVRELENTVKHWLIFGAVCTPMSEAVGRSR